MRNGTRTILGMALGAALTARVGAQAPAPMVELQGRVFLGGDTASLAGAQVDVMPSGPSAVTRRDGTYRLTGLSLGRVTLRVRLIGLASRTLELDLSEPGVRRQDIAMSRLPHTLTEVRIAGRMRRVPPRFDDVYRRMAVANGTFFTAEDFDQFQPIDMLSVLSRVPTARVRDQGVAFAKCINSGAYIGANGKVQIYVDGLRMTRRFDEREQREIFAMVPPSQVQAVEVYTSTSRIPGEFLDDACAVIAIWRK